VAVTPDELGESWRGGRVHLRLQSSCNGKRVGLCETGPEMHFHFGQLIAHLAKTRNLRAGTIVGSGTVSNSDATHGVNCFAEQRALEILAHGEPRTGYLVTGDRVRIEMQGRDGISLFGAIDQRVGGPLDLTAAADGAAQTAADTAPDSDSAAPA
jgi:fumarylacetoacetate (FAA) hydrolase